MAKLRKSSTLLNRIRDGKITSGKSIQLINASGKLMLAPEDMQAFKDGDLQAFSFIYRKLYPAIFHFANKLLADEEQAKDIAAETFIKVWHKKEDLVSYENIKAFAYIVARNSSFNYLQTVVRRDKSHREILYLEKEEYEDTFKFEQINAEVINELHQEIKLLPTQCRRTFELLFYDGKNSTEAAEIMGTTRKTVLNQKLKAITLLRTALLKKGLLPQVALVMLALLNDIQQR